MRPIAQFRGQKPEFWALVKLVSQEIGYSERGTGRLKRYNARAIARALSTRGLDPRGHGETLEHGAAYIARRAELLEDYIGPNLIYAIRPRFTISARADA
jgi:hypothetical protein